MYLTIQGPGGRAGYSQNSGHPLFALRGEQPQNIVVGGARGAMLLP